MKISILSFSLYMTALVLASCEGGNDKRPNNVSLSNKKDTSLDCLEQQRAFLKWYLVNFEKLDSVSNIIKYPKQMLSQLGSKKSNSSSTKYYQFNSENMNAYLDDLEKSGYFSKYYIDNKRKDMLKRGKILDANKQEEGPAYGFEFDEVFHTQEMYTIDNIADLKPDSSRRNAYIIQMMENFKWVLYVNNKNGKCVIDSITSE